MTGLIGDRDLLVKMVKACGQEVIDRAEDLVGNGNEIADLDIWIKLNSGDRTPTIEVTREYYTRNTIQVLQEEFDKSH